MNSPNDFYVPIPGYAGYFVHSYTRTVYSKRRKNSPFTALKKSVAGQYTIIGPDGQAEKISERCIDLLMNESLTRWGPSPMPSSLKLTLDEDHNYVCHAKVNLAAHFVNFQPEIRSHYTGEKVKIPARMIEIPEFPGYFLEPKTKTLWSMHYNKVFPVELKKHKRGYYRLSIGGSKKDISEKRIADFIEEAYSGRF